MYNTTPYTVIYVFSIPDEDHKGQLKIGQTTIKTSKSRKQFPPNCDELQAVSLKRIGQEVKTARVKSQLEHCELAVREVKKDDGSIEISPFTDKDVIKLMGKSGFKVLSHYDSDKPSEWVETSLENAIRGIQAYKEGKTILVEKATAEQKPKKKKITLRQEQEENVCKTLDVLKYEDKMLWDCKMRYGKTVTAYELIRRGLAEGRFKKTIVITHRPAVEDGWGSDHALIFDENEHIFIDKSKGSEDTFDAVIDRNNDAQLADLVESGKPFIYFASIQDLRGSKLVGGKHNKNNGVFNTPWDLLIIDEAHEGTTTELGKAVIANLLKYGTKKLELSGTPYEQLKEYDAHNTYSWSYVDEQKAKESWEELHPLEPNPYIDLPKMNICTFDLGKGLEHAYRFVSKDMMFSFSKFFSTWKGNLEEDMRPMPEGAQIGDFVYEEDVFAFLNLITKEDKDSLYPFSTHEFRTQFRHTFWRVPGVKAGAALSKLLKKHPVFMHYKVVNVAGEGDEGYDTTDPLKSVREAIKNNPYTITLSCGKLTTGVTVKEWSACMMLAGSYTTSAQSYMQTIFRVQSPGSIDGRRKENVYVFDFAPDRTLKVVSDVHNIKTSGGLKAIHSNSPEVKAALDEFLKFCPVLSFDGTRMLPLDVPKMMRAIKRISIERAISSGFDDDIIYLAEAGIVFQPGDAEIIKTLSDIVDPQHKGKHNSKYTVNDQGLTGEDIDTILNPPPEPGADSGKKKSKKNLLTPEQKALKDKLDAQKKEQTKLFNLLRSIAIRLPLLFYGADADIDEIDSLEYFADKVDADSWEEFMPKRLTKEFFKALSNRFFDQDVVIGAGLRIRMLARQADDLLPTKRAKEIVRLMSTFRNPDKETVLTPWRVVNIHIGDTLGGYNFFNEDYSEELEEPRLIEHGDITADVFCNPDARILEMNSKTGLYPLYMTFGIYLLKISGSESNLSLEEAQTLWAETVSENIYVLCKTPMAAKITKRTLMGYGDINKVNTCYLPHLIDSWMKEKQDKLAKKLKNPATWGKQDKYQEGEKMTFNAIVGNPPYQEESKSESSSKSSIYHLFLDVAQKAADLSTFITPARFLFNAGNTPKEWNKKMLESTNVKLVTYEPDATKIFPETAITGGIAITLFDRNKHFTPIGIYVPFKDLNSIRKKVVDHKDFTSIKSIISGRTPYLFTDAFHKENPNAIGLLSEGHMYDVSSNAFSSLQDVFLREEPYNQDEYYRVLGRLNNTRTFCWIKKSYVRGRLPEYIGTWKVFLPKANGASGMLGDEPARLISKPVVGRPNDISTDTFLCIGILEDEKQATALFKYLNSKFARVLLGVLKVTQDNTSDKWAYVPMQDFSSNSDIDWSHSVPDIDKQLYKKYELSENEIAFIESKVSALD